MSIYYFGQSTKFFNTLKKELEDASYEVLLKTEKASLEKCELALIDFDEFKDQGQKIAQRIKNYEKENQDSEAIHIIFLANKDELQSRMKAFDLGADEFVEKSSVKEVRLKIDTFLRPDLLWRGLITLLVEDDLISAKFISHILRSKGAEVKHFPDGLNALEYLKTGPKVDLILTDHLMPNLSGVSFVKKVRNEFGMKSVPIVFISSVREKAEVLEFYQVGGNDFVSKPLIKEELFVKVNQLLENRIKSELLHQQIEEQEKLSRIKDQFLAVCSHDLRTPLNTILGLSNFIIEEGQVDEDTGGHIKQIESSARDLLDMVTELLDFSEVQLIKDSVKREKVDLVDVLKNCFLKINAVNTKGINFSVETKLNSANIKGSKLHLTRLFNNLLSNAYKFTDNGGEVKGTISRKKKSTIVTITDTGIGFPEHFKSELFNEMSGVGRKGLQGEKSTGLGMSIVKKIIDNHNATIEVDSKEGVGTTFTICFEA